MHRLTIALRNDNTIDLAPFHPSPPPSQSVLLPLEVVVVRGDNGCILSSHAEEQLLQQILALPSLRKLQLSTLYSSSLRSLVGLHSSSSLCTLPAPPLQRLRTLSLSCFDLSDYPQLLEVAYHLHLHRCYLSKQLCPSPTLQKLSLFDTQLGNLPLILPHCTSLRSLATNNSWILGELSKAREGPLAPWAQRIAEAATILPSLRSFRLTCIALTLEQLPFLLSRWWRKLYCTIAYHPEDECYFPLPSTSNYGSLFHSGSDPQSRSPLSSSSGLDSSLPSASDPSLQRECFLATRSYHGDHTPESPVCVECYRESYSQRAMLCLEQLFRDRYEEGAVRWERTHCGMGTELRKLGVPSLYRLALRSLRFELGWGVVRVTEWCMEQGCPLPVCKNILRYHCGSPYIAIDYHQTVERLSMQKKGEERDITL